MNRRRAFISLFFITLAFIFAGGVAFYWQSQQYIFSLVRERFTVGASEAAGQLGIAVKINDVPSIYRLIQNSYVQQHSQWLTVLDLQKNIIAYFGPPEESEKHLHTCELSAINQAIYYNDRPVGILSICFDEKKNVENTVPLGPMAGLVVGFVALFSILYFWYRRETKAAGDLLAYIDSIEIDPAQIPPTNFAVGNFRGTGLEKVAKKIHWLLSKLSESMEKLRDQTEKETLFKVARQVAHDIRSPLYALNTVLDRVTLSSHAEKDMVRSAMKRIVGIAENILVKPDAKTQVTKSEEVVCLPEIFEELILEYRILLQGKGIKITWSSDELNSYFCYFSSSEMKRVLANIMNNAIAAISHDGFINILLCEKNPREIIIKIEDSGTGIPPDVLPRVFEEGFSFGKSGSGLGLSYAKKMVVDFGGQIEIRNRTSHGTIVELSLRKAPTPKWFVRELALEKYSEVLICDDDASILEYWKKRLGLVQKKISYFQSLQELQDYLENYSNNSGPRLVLVDNRFYSEKKIFMEVAVKTAASDEVVIVTSDSQTVVTHYKFNEKTKILPKSCLDQVRIIVPKHPMQGLQEAGDKGQKKFSNL